jgi:hypothetical protein
MPHVFRLGPFTVGDRDAYAYAALDDDGAMLPPHVAHTDAEGLGALARELRGPLRCESALRAAGEPFGFVAAELPAEALLPRAVLAYGLGNATSPKTRPPLALLVRFFRACATFWGARPWDLVDSDDPVPVTLDEGGRRTVREGSILGGGGEEFGLALYDERGSIARVVAAVNRGDMRAAGQVSSVVVMLSEEPTWAASAFGDAFGLPRIPLVMRTLGRKSSSGSAADLLALTAALEAVTGMVGGAGLAPAQATVEVEGASITARVGLPEVPDQERDGREPMLVSAPVAAPHRSERIPRNAPCPCGSGRKYKKCHLGEDEERERAARGTGPAAAQAQAETRRLAERDPIHDLDERLTADALALARQRWGRAFDPEGLLSELGVDDRSARPLLGWSAAHYRGPNGRTALELYLEERGGALDEVGRSYAAALQRAWFSYHEVVAAEPGVSLTLRDMLAGGERVVQEKTASRVVGVRTVLLARVVELEDRTILAGCHLRPLPPGEGDLACRFARKALRTRAKRIAPAKLRELTADGTLFAGWEELVRAADRRPLPQLCNTDGDEVLLTVDRFELAPGKAGEAAAALRAMPGAQDASEEGGPVSVDFVREGNAKGVLESTLVGRATIEGSALRVETNSVQRADALRILVEDHLGTLVRFRVREHSDPTALLEQLRSRGAPEPEREPMPPEVLDAMRKMQEEHYRRWLDEPIPALGGLTPRAAAAKGGAAGEKLRVLLAEIEHAEGRAPEGQRFDVGVLRRELGIA